MPKGAKAEGRNPKKKLLVSAFWIRASDFGFLSAFGLRVSDFSLRARQEPRPTT